MSYEPVFHPTWIEIDAQQLLCNFRAIKKYLGSTQYCLPVKANAYGHGLVEVAQLAEQASLDYLGVSSSSEGVSLREHGIKLPILVFGAIHEQEIGQLLKHNLEFTLSSLFKAQRVAEELAQAPSGLRAKVHIEVDTGIRRTGVRPQSLESVYRFVVNQACFKLKGISSHFAAADEPENSLTREQIQAFQGVMPADLAPGVLLHIANSPGIINFPSSHLAMARPGLLSFGLFAGELPAALRDIKPAYELKSRVSYFKTVLAQQGIGYAHSFVPKENTNVVTVPIGYGDGYRRALSNKAEVLIRGKRYPVVGNISMDQLTVNIGKGEAHVGDVVTLLGHDGSECISIFEMARWLDTIPYEVLCSFNSRVPRHFLAFPKS